jgi:hypothetical protein
MYTFIFDYINYRILTNTVCISVNISLCSVCDVSETSCSVIIGSGPTVMLSSSAETSSISISCANLLIGISSTLLVSSSTRGSLICLVLTCGLLDRRVGEFSGIWDDSK